jgi:3-methylcrotonyl-CoA carboxylase alpha subunit
MRHGDEERSIELMPPATDGPASAAVGGVIHVDVDGQSLEFAMASAPTVDEAVRHASSAAGEGASLLTAPMPGRVIAVRVAEGAAVTAHQAVVVIEAMKMEHAVVAPTDGTLVRLTVGEGEQVERGQVLGEVAAYHDADG